MAKYAQGFERKNSDTKNLIILFSVIVGVIAIAIVGIIIYNAFYKETTYSYDSVSEVYVIKSDNMGTHEGCYYQSITSGEGDAILTHYKNMTSYYVFFNTSSDSDSTIKAVLDYYDKKGGSATLYLLTLPSSTTELFESIEDDLLGPSITSLSSGMLLKIENNKITSVYQSDVVGKIKELSE